MENQEQLKLETNEAKSLIESGVEFEVGKRKYKIKEFYAGTLDILSGIFIEMQFDENTLQENPIGESKLITKKSIRLCAKALAVAVLNNKWKIRLFTPFLANKFLWSITPSRMFKGAVIIAQMSNFGDFINFIRLTAGVRTTKPNPIKENQDNEA